MLKLGQFAFADCCVIDGQSPQNDFDIKSYIECRLADIAADDDVGPALLSQLAAKCNGNFLVASAMLDDLADSRTTLGKLLAGEAVALTLQTVYESAFQRLFPLETFEQKKQWQVAQMLLSTVMAEPIPRHLRGFCSLSRTRNA